jgi:hypothetical protein
MTSYGGMPDAQRPVSWWRQSAPPEVGWPLVGTFALLLAAGIGGAIWAWPWPVTCALLLPGIVAHLVLAFRAAPARRRRPPMGVRLIFAGACGLLGSLSADVRPTYIAPLSFVLVLIVLVEPVWRALHRRIELE